MSKLRKTKDYYINLAKEIHGNKFDYSKADYQGAKKKVCIICPEHGEFWQTFDNHVNSKKGCPKCAGNTQKTTEEFIGQGKAVHGDRYDYSKTKYVNNSKKVIIICKEHGEFEQVPPSHLRGSNCPVCTNRAPITTQGFIERATKVHGNRYDYSEVEYNGSGAKVVIKCAEHGRFEQVPYNHITGKQGCPSCGNLAKGVSQRSSKEKFIKTSLEVHGEGSFDYSEVEYQKNNIKVKITCRYGHTFWQTPANHITGFGCPECALGWPKAGYYKTDYPAALYVLNFDNQFLKVGITKDLKLRMRHLKKETGIDNVIAVKTVEGKAKDVSALETSILRQSGLERYIPDLSFAGETECLYLEDLPTVLDILSDFN